ncbi:hypothetical protein BT69DRAFT_1275461 [Atractiella rhizophila]|nr:hypothetical protein BT69DRAFT_1275461 [Atractiella rhizophila]
MNIPTTLATLMRGRQRSRGATLSSRRGSKPHFSRSKKGCLTCRQRRVKCGEEQPVCANCGRLYLNCVYAKDHIAAHHTVQDQPLDSYPTTPSHPSPEQNSQTTSQTQPQYLSSFRAMPSRALSRRTPKAERSSITPPPINQPEITSGTPSSLNQSKLEILKQRTTFPQQRPIQLSSQDESFIRHFVEVLAPTSKAIEPQQPNFLLDLFLKSLFSAPLYEGLMAYAALHLSRQIDRPDLLTIAHSKHQRSMMLLEYPWDSSAVHLRVDIILATLLVYALWEVSHGTTSQTMDLIFDMAREAVTSTNQTFASLPSTAQSCAIILARICFTSSSFGARVPKFLHWLLESTFGPSLGDNLSVALPSMYVDWLRLYQFAAQAFRSSLAITEQFDTAIEGGRVILQRIISFKEQLDGGHDFRLSYCIDGIPAIFVNFSPDLLNLLYKSVFVNSLIIYLTRIIHCRPESHYGSEIVTIGVTIAQSGEDPSHHIFPWCLLFAGLEASNPQDYRWISAYFDRMASAGWISTKAKLLMEQIREEEAKSGRTQLPETILQSRHLVAL